MAAFDNSVIVESKTVVAGTDSVWVGIFISNNLPVRELYLPLELRSLTPGAFVRSRTIFADNPTGRLYNSPLSDDSSSCWSLPWLNPDIWIYAAPESANECSGPVSQSYGFRPSINNAIYVSPDAYSLWGNGTYCGSLAPGEDPPVSDSASCYFVFDVTDVPGQFEIDTCCANGHLQFRSYSPPYSVTPGFVKGVITILCTCPCHADPVCDGWTDVLDVMSVIDVAFRGQPEQAHAGCRSAREDVDCNGLVDVADVVKMIEAAIRGAEPGAVFCDPCS
ncbi:MAG: hypothetical protein HY304_09745 [candidate division Zixibacteria bacterium]|nr:hypothetical protein [candidate division Zixibacteria bacterium]